MHRYRAIFVLLLSIGITRSSPAMVAASDTAPLDEAVLPAVSTSIITLCGLAVVLVVQPQGGDASLFAGSAMQSRLLDLGITVGSPGQYELTDIYLPLADSCAKIRNEHDRVSTRPNR